MDTKKSDLSKETTNSFPKLSTKSILSISILILASAGVFYLIQGVFNQNIYTDYYISGGSLAGAVAAIQLSDLNQKFVISSDTNWLGGQATVEGVSAFDEHGKVYQKNSIYQELSAENIKDRLPPVIEKYIQNRINSRNGRTLYETKAVSVQVQNDVIQSVQLKTSSGRVINVFAKYYLESEDFLNMAKFTDVKTSIGLDSSENTQEAMALSSKEKEAFENGFTLNRKNIEGFGERIQPITTPFAVVDRGYTGLFFKAYQLSNKNLQFCTSLSRDKCLQVKPNTSQEISFRPPALGKNSVSLVLNQPDFSSQDSLKIVNSTTKQEYRYTVQKQANDTFLLNFELELNQPGQIDLSLQNGIGQNVSLFGAVVNQSGIDQYTDLVVNNWSESGLYEVLNSNFGEYEVWLQNLSDNTARVNINGQNGDSEISNQRDLAPGEQVQVGRMFLSSGQSDWKLSAQCESCLSQITMSLKESRPAGYSADFFNQLIGQLNFRRFLLTGGQADENFFRYRQSVYVQDMPQNQNLSRQVRDLFTPNSLGITQVNTPFNDYPLDGIDVQNYKQDDEYRKQVWSGSVALSKNYYYWLKYDAASNYLGCTEGEYFCSGKRISILPEAMDGVDGYADKPYQREVTRIQGESQLTYKDLAWQENECTGDQECLELVFKSYSTSGEVSSRATRVNSDFLEKVDPYSILGFYYPTDVHDLVHGREERIKLRNFYDFLIQNGYRTRDDLPSFLGGLFNSKVKAGSLGLNHVLDPKIKNLLYCGKNISMTQIANGSVRLHPGEAALGQACAILITLARQDNWSSLQEAKDKKYFKELQYALAQNGHFSLPLEDEIFLDLRSLNMPDVIAAYNLSLIEGVLKAKVGQDDLSQYVIMRFEPSQLVSEGDVQKLLEKLSIQTDFGSQTSLNGDFNFVSDEKDREKLVDLVEEYRIEMTENLGQEFGSALTRGDLAWVSHAYEK